jgi:hypothetical protein
MPYEGGRAVNTPKLIQDKGFQFALFMVWIALAGAVIILLIDYQIKSAILAESERAWGRIHAIEAGQRGTDNTAATARRKPRGMRGDNDSRMEVAPMVLSPSGKGESGQNGARAAKSGAGKRSAGIPGDDKQIQE